MALPRMDRPAIVISEKRWKSKSPDWRRGFRTHWTRRGFQVWIQRMLRKNPYWHNATLQNSQIQFSFANGRNFIYDIPGRSKIQFPTGVYAVQVRYKANGVWEPWHSPGNDPVDVWAEPKIEPGDVPKFPKGYRGIRRKPQKVKKFPEAKVKKKPKKKRKKKAKAKPKKKPVGKGRPSKTWWKRAIKQIKKYRPEVKDRKKLAGWHWHHGTQKLDKKSVIAAGRTVKEWAALYKKYNDKIRKAG